MKEGLFSIIQFNQVNTIKRIKSRERLLSKTKGGDGQLEGLPQPKSFP